MKKQIILASLLVVIGIIYITNKSNKKNVPIVAIANYGSHSSLNDSILGIKHGMEEKGYIENENIIYKIADVNFEFTLIPQMIASLNAAKPKAIVALSTPIAQYAKHYIKDIPIIYDVVTDPVEAGLLSNYNQKQDNGTCSSDKQNLSLLLKFAKEVLPKATRVGILYSTTEANDAALVKMLEKEAQNFNIKVVAVAIDQARDIPIRMQLFKDQVDFIYVGTSGAIQPALPVIIANADNMFIPVFNANEEAVLKNQAFASFGVDYYKMGIKTGYMLAKIISENIIQDPIYPTDNEHSGFISKKKADQLKISIPQNLANVRIVE